jgi:hypothetical protein
MPQPLILITTSTIKDGKLDGVKALSTRFADLVEEHDTALMSFDFYINDDGTLVSNVQVHRDAESMEAYLPVAQPLIAEALQLTHTDAIDVFGAPGPIFQQVLRMNAEQGATVRVMPSHLAGFTTAARA